MSVEVRPEFDATAPLPDGTLLLEASAGTGKTYTITSLVLRAVAELGIELEQLLVVTFTRAAAAELRGRIRTRLLAALHAAETAVAADQEGTELDLEQLADGDRIVAHLLTGVDAAELRRRAARLRTAAEELDQATIDTIHGFCSATLSRAAPDVAVELDLELAEDVTGLIDELVHDHLVRELRHASDAWYRLVTAHVRPDQLREIARRLEAEPHLRVLPEPTLTGDPTTTWEEAVADLRARWAAQGTALVAWLADHGKDGFEGRYYNRTRPAREAAKLTAWCAEPVPDPGDLDAIHSALTYVSRRAIETRATTPAAVPDHLDVIDAADRLLALPGELATDVLVRFAGRVRGELTRRKTHRGVLSFGDLLVRLDEALADDATAAAVRAGVRARFSMALIDEFQDTDPVQWRIFDRLFGADARLQLIGDPKQAIYAFRGADVGTYLEVVQQVPADRRFTLLTNHRSDARYLDAVDQLFDPDRFGSLGPFGVADIPFPRVRARDSHREDRLRFPDGPRPPLVLRFVPRSLAAEDGGDPPAIITKGWAGPNLTRALVADVVELLTSGATLPADDDDVRRPVGPGDLAVLVRTNAQAQRIQTALLDAGVPAVLESDASVLHSPEATAVQRLLDALLAPSLERAVRPALLGPLIGVDAATLDAATDAERDGWAESLVRWATAWQERGIAVALRQVLDEQQAAEAVLQRARGERTLTNLLHLREVLHRVEATDRLGPAALAAWLREQRRSDTPEATDRQLRLESDADAVTVVTVHRAKGLQYGVVFCPLLWESRPVSKTEARVLRYRDPVRQQLVLDVEPDVDRKDEACQLAARARWEESLRLLYVALTRAEHRCVLMTGAFTSSGASPLYRLLHAAAPGPDGKLPTDPRDRSDEQLLAELRALASPEVEVTVLEAVTDPPRWTPPGGALPTLVHRDVTRPLDRSWQRTSFSRLTAGEHPTPRHAPPDDARDLDHLVGEPADGPLDAGATPRSGSASASDALLELVPPLAGFPRGPRAGTFLHELLEHLDLTADRERIAALVDERLRRSPFEVAWPGAPGGGRDLVDPGQLVEGIVGVLMTPLGPVLGDRRLADIPRGDRLDELAFDLPLAGGYAAGDAAVTLEAIAAVAERHAPTTTLPLERFAARLRARRSAPVRGFLTGSIDLVARLDGRYLLADHKSNWLGTRERLTLADHHPDRLAEAMLEGDYLLQASLYLVALHRFLRLRLPGYDYDRHVAGFAYLFLRGMVGPGTPRGADGTPYGVVAARPPRTYVEQLDAVLRGEAP